MGTRNMTMVKLGGELKVSQYGQWDGYPTGQGATIAEFLESVDLDKFKKQVSELKPITDEQRDKVNNTNDWQSEFPYLSRDAGADILQMIHSDEVKFVLLEDPEADNWTEYDYVIDLDKETVSVNNGTEYTFAQWTVDLMDFLEDYRAIEQTIEGELGFDKESEMTFKKGKVKINITLE